MFECAIQFNMSYFQYISEYLPECVRTFQAHRHSAIVEGIEESGMEESLK